MAWPQIQQGALARWSRVRQAGRMISVHLREERPLLLGTPRSVWPPMSRAPRMVGGPYLRGPRSRVPRLAEREGSDCASPEVGGVSLGACVAPWCGADVCALSRRAPGMKKPPAIGAGVGWSWVQFTRELGVFSQAPLCIATCVVACPQPGRCRLLMSSRASLLRACSG